LGIISRRRYLQKQDFPGVIANLVRSFESLREEYLFGSLSQLKREGVDVSRIPRDVTPASEIEDVLKGFQVTSMMGIAWEYIRETQDQLDFDKTLSAHLKAHEGSRAWSYRETYRDCRGNIDALCKSLAADVHRVIGFPEPRLEFLIQFSAGAQVLIGLSQAAACSACGDDKRARTLKQHIASQIA